MIQIGKYVKQKGNYYAFVPETFPPKGIAYNEPNVVKLLADANLLLGKLDGLTKLIPDIDFFIFMYMNKEAAFSSQVEGTKANLTDALQAEVERTPDLPNDVDDILHYIKAMNMGLERLNSLPLSLRLIKEVHATLLTGKRNSTSSQPGEFRNSQNWVMGTNLNDARFVPPPPQYVLSSMGELEKFLYSHSNIPALLKAALMHSQFETIHPFLDGNGRTGRLLITLYLCHQNVLERPVLYFSEYLKKHRNKYFLLLDDYRKGNVSAWLEFFLEGVIQICSKAIETSNKIVDLREKNIQKISSLGRAGKNAMVLLKHLYKLPIVNVKKVEEATGLSREAANRLVKRFCKEGILMQKDQNVTYGRLFVYRDYLSLFE
ncbi:MAG: Fic family protein [Candidatus Aminicenantes bacterium]|nr:Fic family protein [Candidatus Aminicenantes bacterium]